MLWGKPEPHCSASHMTTSSQVNSERSVLSPKSWYHPSFPSPANCGMDGLMLANENPCFQSGNELPYGAESTSGYEEISPKDPRTADQSASRIISDPQTLCCSLSILAGSRLLSETQANADGQKLLDDSESPSDFSLQNRSEPETLEMNSEITTVSHPIPDRLHEEPYLNNGLRTPYLNQLFCAKALFSESIGSLPTSCVTDTSSYAEHSKRPRWINSPYATERIQPNAGSQPELVDPLNEIVTRSELNRLYQSVDRTEDPTVLATPHSHSVTTVSTNNDATSVQAHPSPVYPSLISPEFSNTRPTSYETKSFRAPTYVPFPSHHSFIPQATTHRPSFSPYGGGLRHFGPVAGTGFQHYSSNSFGYGLDGARRKNATRESTTTLKVWLQEHIKNPYPTKGEKIMLAIITKMTLTQVSTWFANARRRLKKENKMSWPPKSNSNSNSGTISGNKHEVTKVGSRQSPVDHNNRVLSLEDEQPDALKHTVDGSELHKKNGVTVSSVEEVEDDDDDDEDIDEDTEEETNALRGNRYLRDKNSPVTLDKSRTSYFEEMRSLRLHPGMGIPREHDSVQLLSNRTSCDRSDTVAPAQVEALESAERSYMNSLSTSQLASQMIRKPMPDFMRSLPLSPSREPHLFHDHSCASGITQQSFNAPRTTSNHPSMLDPLGISPGRSEFASSCNFSPTALNSRTYPHFPSQYPQLPPSFMHSDAFGIRSDRYFDSKGLHTEEYCHDLSANNTLRSCTPTHSTMGSAQYTLSGEPYDHVGIGNR
ncbi:hypothetical protein EG68_08330 [Paragonimus skrjabini miyazakii]|uniref:Homeobox domain-containing protein n=1 Tax=Paragonimus skrjabini miyazakii TaxID=59628 RepID=A0A8S9YK63_9TREM|nr:hypothetical protein EG68_08330 [Paragonimus skrjabini miyazakii]